MPEIDLFNTIYGKLGLFGVLCLVIWKVYHDMKTDKKELVEEIRTTNTRFEAYRNSDHERCMRALEDNAHSRKQLAHAITRMSQATERLPCNQSQPSEHRWTTPANGTPTPPEGTAP